MSEELSHIQDAERFTLIVRVCDGIATDAENKQLQALLESDDDMRELYLQYANMHAQLQWQSRGGSLAHELSELTQLIEAETELLDEMNVDHPISPELSSVQASQRRSKLHIHQHRGIRIPARLVVAACLLVGLIPLVVAISISMNNTDVQVPVVQKDKTKPHIDSVATIHFAANAVVKLAGKRERDERHLADGEQLAKGGYTIEHGRVTFQFKSGATVSLVAPAEIEIVSPMQMKINEGQAVLVIPEQAYGFQAITPQMQVTDLGTSFGITVDNKSGQSELHVIQGEVELQTSNPDSSFKSERVTTGYAKQVDARGQAEVIDYQGIRYLNLINSDELQLPVNRSYLGWVGYREKMMKNADTLLFLDFEELDYGDENVLNHAGNTLQCKRYGSFDVTGRFASKRALAFQEVDDRIDFEVKHALSSFTLSCWLGFDEIGNSALIMSDGFGLPGQQLRWQFHDNGDLRLTIMRNRENVERFYAKKVITPNHFGRWIHLVTTYDIHQASVKHFVNGELVAEHTIEDRQPVKIGSASIGNWNNGNATRRFVGRIDEVLILEKALNDNEVAKLYQNGMPYNK